MGHAIVYCTNCSAQLRGSDFESRRAFKVDDLNFCAKCCREVLGSEPAPDPGPSTPKLSASGRIPLAPHPAPPAAAPERSGATVGIVAAVGITVVLVLLVLVFSGGGERRTSTPPVAAPAPKPAAPREAAMQEPPPRDLAVRREARAERERTDWKQQDAKTPEAPKTEVPVALVKPEPAAPPPPPATSAPAPVPPDRSREEAAARAARWEAALAPSTARDYPAAIAALEKLGNAAPDLALLKSVASLHQDSVNVLARTPKGQKIAVDFRDGTGGLRRVEGSFVEMENAVVELRTDSGAVEIEVGEIAPSWLAGRVGTADPAAAAVFALLEGDEAGARRLIGDKAGTIPERYWTYARKVAGASDPARPIYQEAVALGSGFTTAADASPKYQTLLRDHAESSFVKRNRATITARIQTCARDHLFVAADLKPSGAFKGARSVKGNACWTSDNDSDLSRLKENFVELTYSVLPDATYKCWIYAGGCCQEVFEFWVQGTEMKGGKEKEPVEPGTGAAVNVKPWLSSLKKTHAMHTGPKQPTHWDWVPIPLPKYSKAGVQQVRVLSAQKGFSVAFACVTATRSGAPREAEMRELEKSRGAATPAPAVAQGPKATVLFSLALDGSERLVGECRDRALYGVPMFGQLFTGIERAQVLKIVPQGEVRLTYFLKSATPLNVRLRIPRGDRSDMYDVRIAQPVVGRPTELRLPLSDFKPPYDKTVAPFAVGEVVTMLYIFGEDPACGLRLDALSAVEFK